ncbi:phosphoglycerate kinase [Candidatus Thorarchaeota archaeon]|nr:MAG: phosphoglycerate kinase [Candidatus Thorarchaeota archaeon]
MNLPFKTLDDIEYDGKRALVRVDINSSVDPNTKKITDDSRIRAIIPTLEDLRRSKVVLMAHQGRPGSNDFISLEQHTQILVNLGFDARFVDDIFGEKAKEAIQKVKVGEILVLQNVRMFEGELKRAPVEEVSQEPIVQELYPLFDLFVNDAFGAAHRSQASIVGFTVYLPSVAGRLMEEEIWKLSEVLSTESHPWILILGGSKVADKLKTVKKLLDTKRADTVLIGGLIGNLFLVANGTIPETYAEPIEGYESLVETAQSLLSEYPDVLHLPVDAAVQRNGNRVECEFDEMAGDPFYDIGPKTIETFTETIGKAGVTFANGPMGFFEKAEFDDGTIAILKAMAHCKCTTVVGGGHLGAMAEAMNLEGTITHISTGGGATMNFMTGKKLPLIEALEATAKRMSS